MCICSSITYFKDEYVWVIHMFCKKFSTRLAIEIEMVISLEKKNLLTAKFFESSPSFIPTESQMDGFWDLVGIKDGPLSKHLAVNSFFSREITISISTANLVLNFLQNIFITHTYSSDM